MHNTFVVANEAFRRKLLLPEDSSLEKLASKRPTGNFGHVAGSGNGGAF